VQAGAINHAIRVTFNTTQRGYIPPAYPRLGQRSARELLPTDGLRLRLKAATPISTYTKESQVIMTAMKAYGGVTTAPYYESVLCGRAIRKAFTSGVPL
jgi:hypothetical protein